MIKFLYYVFHVKNHKKVQEQIFQQYINQRQKTPTHDGCFISNTDWINGTYHSLGNFHYIDFLLQENQKKLDDFYKKNFLRNKQYQITNAWFNQYDSFSGAEHKIHAHPNSDITNIYYLELKDKHLATHIIHPQTKKVIRPNVREGDILCFPGNIEHYSPKNFTKTRKTVLAFNIDIK
jgi:hypothetical protein